MMNDEYRFAAWQSDVPVHQHGLRPQRKASQGAEKIRESGVPLNPYTA